MTEYQFGEEGTSAGAAALSTTGSQSNAYFNINSFALNKESPAVNIITNKPFGYNWELVVTARALHPNMDGANARNKYNFIYTGSAETYIEGSYTLKKESNIIVADGFQRADDWDFAKGTTGVSDIPNMRIYFTDSIYNSTQRTFFRYKEEGTEWDSSNKQYHIMDSNGETDAFFSGDLGSRLFLPDRAYELEIVNVVYGTGSNGQKVIYWPQDESLLEPGKGWKEAGYQLWDGTWGYAAPGSTTYGEIYNMVKNTPQEPHHYLIPESTIYFDRVENQWGDYETIDGKVKTVGSESSPKQLSNGGSNQNYDKHFMIRVSPTSFNIDKTQVHFTAKIDKWENGNWVPMISLNKDSSMNENVYKWFLQVSVPRLDLYHIRADASGKYRIRTTVTGMTWTKISGGLFESGAGRYQNYVVDNIDLFDMSDESGVVYIQLN